MKKLFIILSLCCFVPSVLAQDYNPNRYRKAIFPSILSVPDVYYGSAPQWIWPYWDEDLYLDVYTPNGDDNPKRPLIIFAHSGGFINGSKDVDDMVAICDSFARKGFVTASIEYRKGFDPLDAESAERAAYRGLQDGKAAVRYFKENASFYDIDTNYIFFGGMSAGGFISLNVAYMDKEEERPESTYGGGLVNDLECLDCAGNDFPHTSKVRAILDFWGGVDDTLVIEPGDIPMMIMHGEHDETVPFVYGHPFGLFTLPESYGGQPISERAAHVGVYYEFFTSEGPLHMLDGSDNGTWDDDSPNSFWSDTLLPESTRFLWENMKPNTVQISDEYVEVCYGESALFEVSAAELSHFIWTYDTDLIVPVADDNSEVIELNFATEGVFEISVIEFNEILCAGDTVTFMVEVAAEVLANFSETIVDLNTVNFENESTGGVSYVWNFGDGESSDEFNPVHTYSENGTYEVTLIVTNESGCSDTITQTVVIVGLGLWEDQQNQIGLYPNPIGDILTIVSPQVITGIRITDASGRMVYHSNEVFSGMLDVDATNWSPGIYFVQVENENAVVLTRKLMKQ